MFTPSPQTFEVGESAALFFGYVVVLLGAAAVSLVRRDS